MNKDREIKILEGFFEKKFSKDYIDKLSVLLHNSKNKINYSQKRNNIKKAIYKLDDNNELCLTLPKLKKFKNVDGKPGINNNGNLYTKTETTEYTNNKISSKPSAKKTIDDKEDILDENIKEILYDNDNDKKDKKEEKKGKILFEKLRNKDDLFDSEKNIKNFKKKLKSFPKIQKGHMPPEYKLIATPQQISEFDYYLGRSFVDGNLRFLTKSQKEKLAYIAELNIFNSIDKLKEKTNTLKEIKYGNQSRKRILMPIDVFKYDEEKWKKFSYEKNRHYNNLVINELNDKNFERLNNMKEQINKLNVDVFTADKEVNKSINSINNFLNRYGLDTGSRRTSYSSNKGVRYQNSIKKSRRQNEEKKE